MVRMSKLLKNKNKAEETVSLVKEEGAVTAVTSPNGLARLKGILCMILLGCFAIYVWDALEWDDSTGDVQLKIYSGNKQDIQDDKVIETSQEKEKTPAEEIQPKPEPVPATPAAIPATLKPTEAPPPEPIPATSTTTSTTTTSTNGCQDQCAAAKFDSSPFDGEDLTQAANMKTRLQTYRKKWIDGFMKSQYGEYYENIFEPMDPALSVRTHVGKQRAFVSPNMLGLPGKSPSGEKDGPGWHRMVRKYQIKLLQVQLGMLEAQVNPTQYCNTQCKPPTEAHKMKPNHYAKFTWVTGGHSASAGHGNFYDESYTANLGRDLQPIMSAIGLDWQVKNYAMGGTDSGEEVALCHNSIFGKDVDSLSWDYGMTDGHEHNKITLYAYRTARLSQLEDTFSQPGNIKHRPSLIAIHQNDDLNEVLVSMQQLGMTVLGMDRLFKDKIQAALPDMFGMNDQQIDALPPSVQYFKCEGKIETGEPGCQAHKYNDTMCVNRKAKASWHPGFRYHALIGHLMAFTVLEVVEQALDEMIKNEPTTPEKPQDKLTRIQNQLKALDVQEQSDYDRIFSTPVPDNLRRFFDANQWKGKNKEADKEAMKVMDLEWLIKDPVFCHTAMLPAEIRYRGYLTETTELVGDVLDEHFEKAALFSTIKEIESPPPNSGKEAARFSFPEPERERNMVLGGLDKERDVCDAQTNADVKDFFYVSSMDGWRWVTIPNAMEQAYYTEFDAAKSHGYIFICMSKCDWGRCPEGDIRQNVMDFTSDQKYGQMNMEVNLVPVKSINCLNYCCALKHDDPDPAKQFVWTPNADGRYEFRAIIRWGTDYSYARFSTFVLL